MRDASLDEFLSGSDEDASEEDEGGERETGRPEAEAESGIDGGEETDPEPDSEVDPEPEGPPPVEDVEPARSTFAWSPDGATCATCGASVEERWESEAGLVCVECKEW